MKIMNIPGFTAEMTLYRTNRHYPFTAVLAADSSGRVFPAVSKGTTCSVRDLNCPSGFSKLFCSGFDPDSCTETGICCTPPRPVPPPPPCPSGEEQCTDGGVNGCCRASTHCCNDNHGCCKDGSTCRSWFGHYFCDPIFITGGDTRLPFSNQPFAAVAPRDRVYFGSRTTLMA